MGEPARAVNDRDCRRPHLRTFIERRRSAAVVTWIYAAGFGVPIVPSGTHQITIRSLQASAGLQSRLAVSDAWPSAGAGAPPTLLADTAGHICGIGAGMPWNVA